MERYTKLQKIGQGSFGCAYLAVKKNDPSARKYVIKEIRMDPRDQQTALREAKLLAALDHPNIIACRESFLGSPNVLCIVTEFADGGDLRKQLTDRAPRRSPFKESDLLSLFVQCCLALKHLHDRKIIHRDIKPENIFLTSSNVVKLGDFGVATVLSHTLACAQTLTGTPYYTSPEICLGKKYNSKTDVWSLGCVLFELATFEHAFNGRSQRQLFENIVNAACPPLRTSAYSSALGVLVAEMLRKNPRDRPSVNQIIRKPIIMDKIQSFLSQRAIAAELNHTVLHGQHIFQRVAAAPPPPTPSPMKKVNQDISPVKRPQQPIRRAPEPAAAPLIRAVQYAAPRSNNRVAKPDPAPALRRHPLKLSGSSKKLLVKKVAVASPSPKKMKPQQQPPSAVNGKAPSPSLRPNELHQRLLQRKKEVIARARQDAQKRKAGVANPPSPALPPPPPAAVRALPPPAPAPAPKNLPASQAKRPAGQKKSPPSGGSSKPASPAVSDRISVFMAQWQAQREKILHNIGSPAASPVTPPPPPAPPVSAVPIKKPSVVVAPPPAPVVAPAPPPTSPLLTATGIVVKRGKKPLSAAAIAAAKQREAMRRDIQERKKLALQKKKPSSAVPSAVGVSPLDDPVILVQNLPDFKPSRARPAKQSEPFAAMPPPAPASVATAGQEEEEDDTPDSTVAEAANLEFQRMLLHLQGVVAAGPADAEEDDDEEDVGEEEEGGGNATATAALVMPLDSTTPLSPLPPPPYESFVTLEVSMLQDPSFKDALRSRLLGKPPAENENEHHRTVLSWLQHYIQDVM